MNTCETCKWWKQHKQYGPVVPRYLINDDSWESEQGWRNLQKVYDFGSCGRFKNRFGAKLDEIVCPGECSGGHGEQPTGGFVETGKDFGCIHHSIAS